MITPKQLAHNFLVWRAYEKHTSLFGVAPSVAEVVHTTGLRDHEVRGALKRLGRKSTANSSRSVAYARAATYANVMPVDSYLALTGVSRRRAAPRG